jgi:hypothetical protein
VWISLGRSTALNVNGCEGSVLKMKVEAYRAVVNEKEALGYLHSNANPCSGETLSVGLER